MEEDARGEEEEGDVEEGEEEGDVTEEDWVKYVEINKEN